MHGHKSALPFLCNGIWAYRDLFARFLRFWGKYHGLLGFGNYFFPFFVAVQIRRQCSKKQRQQIREHHLFSRELSPSGGYLVRNLNGLSSSRNTIFLVFA